MSKIYEALLRAELDKTAEAVDHLQAPSPEGRATTRPQPASSDPASFNPDPFDPASFEASSFGPASFEPAPFNSLSSETLPLSSFSSETLHSARTIDEEFPESQTSSLLSATELNNIRRTTWTPSLPQLPALEERGSKVEQFRSLRSRMHEFRDLNTLKSILVTSGLPQEGKSFIAANLAIALARHKAERVLLIDGDMRRSSLHKLLGCPVEPGLSEYLAGKASVSEIMQRARPAEGLASLDPGLASLTFISGGADDDKAADLSGNHRFDALIQTVEPFFDWIVVDSSPVNLVADAVNLARACDAVLLVARGGITKFETAQRALVELKASKILGFVLNAVESPPSSGGYYGYDSYIKAAE